jgi:hypothetical protein
MRRLLTGLVVLLAILAVAVYAFSEPDIPRNVLEVKYHAGPNEFVEPVYGPFALDNNTGPRNRRIHFRERGPKNAPVLLLLHGSNASFLTWEPWSKILSDHYHVVAVDLPGHGLTGDYMGADYSQQAMVEFVRNFAQAMHLHSFALAGIRWAAGSRRAMRRNIPPMSASSSSSMPAA